MSHQSFLDFHIKHFLPYADNSATLISCCYLKFEASQVKRQVLWRDVT